MLVTPLSFEGETRDTMGAVGVLEERGPPSTRLPRGAYYALTLLTTLNVINVWHRYLITNLSSVSVEECDVCEGVPFVPLCYIEEETSTLTLQESSTSEEDCLQCRYSYSTEFYNLQDGACVDSSQYATLGGVGFTIPFAIATLVAGRLTDTLDRRLLHTGAILAWSLAAAAHGMCDSFECLMVSRVILGIGESFNAPACYALITLYFPHSRRATANGIYSTGTYLGSALSSLCIALAVLLGWRNTAFLSGAFGVLAGAVLFFTVEHNPVMPPTTPGYTRLADDDPPPPLPPSSQEAFTNLPAAAAAAAGHKTVSFAPGVAGNGVGPTGADGDRASYGGIAPVAVDGVSGAGGAGGDRGPVSLRSILPLAGSSAGSKPAASPSASSTSSSSSYEYYHGSGSGTAGGGGPAPGGALGSGGGGGDTAATATGDASVPVSPSTGKTPRFLAGDESSFEGGSGGGGGGGDGRRKKRGDGVGGGGVGGDGVGGGGGGDGDDDGDGGGGQNPFENPFENPFAAGDSAGAEAAGGAAVGGRRRHRAASSPSSSSSSSSSECSVSSSPRGGKSPPGFGAREKEDGDGGEEGNGAKQKRKKRRRRRDHPSSPAHHHHHHHHHHRRRRRGHAGRSNGGDAGEELRTYPPAAAAAAAAAAGADTGAGGVDLVAPYSSALQAAGATPNGSGWGWYDADPAGPPRVSRSVGAQGGGGGSGGGSGGGFRKNDLRQALRMIVSNRVVLVLFAASSARMIATWATSIYMAKYYRREFPSKTSLYSVLNAGFVSVGGMASSYGGGILSDRLRVRDEGVLGYIPALGSLAAILPVAVVLFAHNFYVSIFMLFLTYLVGECWLGPGMACLQMELPKELAGTSVSILLFLNSVISNLGTWFIGVMDPGLATIRRPLFAVLFMSYLSSALLFALLGVMVSKKHRRRKDRDSYLLSLHGGGDDDDALENGSGNPARKEYGGGGGGGGGRRAPSMCEMVRRTLSRSAGGASQTSSFVDFGDSRGDFRGGGGGYEDDDDELERVAFLDHRDDGVAAAAAATSRSALLGGSAAAAENAVAGGGGGGGFDVGARGRGAARRPLLPRGRSATRGDGAERGGRGGSGRNKRGAAASEASASVVDYGIGGSVSSTKMR